MNMKILLISLVSGALLTACGGSPEELEMAPEASEPAATVALPEPAATSRYLEPVEGEDSRLSAMWTANCVGWDNGGRTCSWKCRSGSEWLWATQSVSYGGCTAYANDFCGYTAYRACWSSNKP
jgi:hypothetical protein